MRAIERKRASRGSLRKKAFPFAKQDGIDQQKRLIRKPMLEQRRSQRRAAPKDQVRSLLRLDAANAIHDVRSNAFERAPFQALRPVGYDILRRRIQRSEEHTSELQSLRHL